MAERRADSKQQSVVGHVARRGTLAIRRTSVGERRQKYRAYGVCKMACTEEVRQSHGRKCKRKKMSVVRLQFALAQVPQPRKRGHEHSLVLTFAPPSMLCSLLLMHSRSVLYMHQHENHEFFLPTGWMGRKVLAADKPAYRTSPIPTSVVEETRGKKRLRP